ncbi:MAG TPA: DsrE family protein [Chitinophagales bacterium]|nr:DsrE family protein [Chitinophagales bacterium]HRK26074.1 DsrE family protein [Chitinophagales bacterium]
MKNLLLLLVFMLPAFALHAQETAKPEVDKTKYKIVFQLVSEDTLAHKGLVRQITNTLNAAPNSKIEVVCHGPGINLLVEGKTTQAKKIKELTEQGVLFVACENTLKERKVEKSQILKVAGFVPAGIVEIVKKQNKGWAYIKAGF